MSKYEMESFKAASGDRPRFAADDRGRLFDRRFREVVGSRLEGDRLGRVEAMAALGWAARRLRQSFERLAEAHGLSEGRLQILFRLRHQDGVPLGELARMLHVSPRNVTGLMDHLERDGLAARVPDPEDRRSTQARLTEAGRRRIDAVWRVALDHQAEITRELSPDEVAGLRDLCLRLVQALESDDRRPMPSGSAR